VWDAKQNIYLNYIEFVFLYSGNEIIGVDYHVDCTHTGAPTTHLLLLLKPLLITDNNDPEHGGKVLSNLLLKAREPQLIQPLLLGHCPM
jgi:hypothetical protein